MKTKRTIKNLRNLRILKNLKNLKNLRKLISLTSLISLMSLTTASAQVITTEADFSCADKVTITYNLVTCSPVDVTLYYSPNNGGAAGTNWFEATTITNVSGQPLAPQSTGTNKKLVWNNAADNVSFGKYYFKVAALSPALDLVDAGVVINGVKWATRNLDVGGGFVANATDLGALYQWGRQADGHECRTSLRYPTDNTSSENGVVSGSDLDATTGQVKSTSSAFGKFIKANTGNYDWRDPQVNTLWNRGTEASPLKNTAADPCPAGWRVPTQAELAKLQSLPSGNRVWQTNYLGSGVNGYLITAAATDPNPSASMFLPAAGIRDSSGSVGNVGDYGYYWSSNTNGVNGRYLYFGDGGFSAAYSSTRAYGFSVRCVQEL